MSEKPLQVLTRVAEKRGGCFVDALSIFRRALMTSESESASMESVVFLNSSVKTVVARPLNAEKEQLSPPN